MSKEGYKSFNTDLPEKELNLLDRDIRAAGYSKVEFLRGAHKLLRLHAFRMVDERYSIIDNKNK